MAYKIQDFQDGVIKRSGNKYQFLKNTKIKGIYDSIQELVEANQTLPEIDQERPTSDEETVVAKSPKKRTKKVRE